MSDPAHPVPAVLYRLADVRSRADAVSAEELAPAGWEVCSDPNVWGSVWMRKEANDEQAP